MNKKRFVSLFLALSMLISYIPSNVYAAENIQLTQESGTGDTDYVASSGALDVNYEVTGQWETGFNGNVTLTNTSDSKVEGWEIRFQLPHEITNIWNAQIVNKEDNIYTVKNAGYNANIQPKESVSFGFTAALDGEIHLPTATDLTSAASENSKDDYSIEYRLTNDWQTGYNAEIVIINNTDKNLEGWHLEFDYDAKIDTIWNAAIDKNENKHYSISNADYNSIIAPNSSLTIGFLGHDLNGEPQNFVLYSNKNASIPVSVVTNKTTTEATTEITTSSVNNSESTTESKEDDIEDIVDYSIDSDYDGLPDIFELHIGTDIHKEDTDDDKISDYYEKIYGLTDPLVPDSDGDEIADCDEDHDTDGLTFLEEVTYGTNPLKEDSDLDTLSDYDEVNQYGTDPILWDTDTDTLSDGDDVLLGFDPLLYDTDNNTVCDVDEKVLQTKHVDITCEERPELTGVDVEINMCGNIADNLQVTNVLGVDNYTSDLVGLVGAPIDITCYTSFDNANITYHYDKSLVDDATAAKLGVLSYDETTGLYEDKNAVVDIENGTVSFSTNHFCSLPMCNIEEYKTAITDIPDYILDDAPCNSEWNGKVVTVAEASKILKVSQSDITALAKNQNLYALKATAVYNLKNGTTLKIPHRYFSTLQMGETGLWQVSGDDSRRVLAPYDWDRVYTSRISSSYNFGYEPDGTKGYLPFYEDINLDDPGYIIDEERYFIPSNTLDTKNKDEDDLYDVYEYLGMRLSNGNLFFTSPKEKDMDGDHIPDGKEIVLCEERGGLFRMVSNPIEKDSDGDEIEDNVDPDPLKTNKNPDVNVTTTIVFPDTEPYNDGRAYYFSAYAQNNTFDRLMNYGFDIKFYYGDEENPTEDEFTITDPSSLGVMVIDESKTEVKHILPSLFAEKTWKILVDDTVDMEKLKCMAIFRADNLKNDITSVTKAQDFIVADPDYYNTTLKASVSDSYLVPEARGERAFAISANVSNYKNFSMKNIKATITFDNPENIEFLEDYTSAETTKYIDKIQGRSYDGFSWEIRIKDGIDFSSIHYTVKITADDYDEYTEDRYIDDSDYYKISADVSYGHYRVPSLRYVYVTVKCYGAKTIHISINKLDGVSMYDEEVECQPDEYTYTVETLLADNTLYSVIITADEGTDHERVYEQKIYFLPTVESKRLAEELGQIEVEEFNKHLLAVCEAIAGNYNPNDPSAEGVAIMVVMGYIPYWGTALDIKDLYADLSGDVDATPGQILMDAVAFFPNGDAFKQGGNFLPIVKRGNSIKIVEKVAESGDEIFGVAQKTEKGFMTAVFSNPNKLNNIFKSVGKTTLKESDDIKTIVKAVKKLDKSKKIELIGNGKVIAPFKYLKKMADGLGFEVHHLIEKRFARKLGLVEDDILSVAIDKDTHKQITRRMRELIPYNNSNSVLKTSNASPQEIWKATKQVYSELGMTEYLDELKEFLVEAGQNLDWGNW